MALTSFHLLSYGRDRAPEALSRMGLDRPELRRVGGLRFWKLLGTGRGRTMTLSADLKRWAMVAVWEDEDALAAFLAESPVAARWRLWSREAAHLRLEPLRARGTWSGRVPFDVNGARPLEPGEPIAILTRAAIRPRSLVAFHRAIAPPGADLVAQPGVMRAVGMGDWPVVRQATFSIWRSLREVQAYAYRRADHAEVVRRTREEDWYSEELFARFRVLSAEGTWDGTPVLDPSPPLRRRA